MPTLHCTTNVIREGKVRTRLGRRPAPTSALFATAVNRGPPHKEMPQGTSGGSWDGSEVPQTRHRGEAVSGGRGSVTLRQHDGVDTRGHVLIRRVGRAVVEIRSLQNVWSGRATNRGLLSGRQGDQQRSPP